MTDYNLKFADRAEFLSAITACGWSHESGEAITGHPMALVCGGGTGQLQYMEGETCITLPGYHVNVRGELPECLQSYVTSPARVLQVWA